MKTLAANIAFATMPDTAWGRAMLAAVVHAVSPTSTGGIRLRGHAGPVREAWLAYFSATAPQGTPLCRMPAQISDSRLLGGLDLSATLQAGRPIAEKGLLAEAHDGFVVLAMAERLELSTAAKVVAVMDRGVVVTERDGLALLSPARFGVVALDEGIEDEQPPLSLTERLGLVVDLRALSHRDIETVCPDPGAVLAARALLAHVTVDDAVIAALCAAGLGLGIASLRAPMQAVQVARVLAALDQRTTVCDADAALAATLVLAPRATQLPQMQSEEQEAETDPDQSETPPEQQQADQSNGTDSTAEQSLPPLEDIILDAAMACMPDNLLASLKAAMTKPAMQSSGKAGQIQKMTARGRVIGSRPGDIRGGARLDVIATLRTAAPWQRLRRNAAAPTGRILIRREDFRVVHYRQRSQTTTIFVVDASGSSALQRLAEAKGAVRLLLAECYVRRDEVALIAFRGTTAELVLPPTRALVRAQRALAALPGGGGTPVATGIDAAAALALAVQRSGRSPSVVLMTDGRANVRRDGNAGRAEAQDEARAAARAFAGISAILVDTSPKPQALAAELAMLMGARYVPLPHADARRVAQAVSLLQTPADPAANRRSAA